MTRAHLEALLFVSSKPFTIKGLAKLLQSDEEKVEGWLDDLSEI